MHRQARGFTLIELLVTIAVLGIITALAVASYDFATVKTRRAAATGCLAGAAQALERHYTLHFSYVGAPAPACSADVTDHYVVGFASGEPTATTYVVQAVPQGRQAESDTRCGTLTVDDTGRRGAGDGSAAAIDACW
jgi:type IV pilus assembly protein PilE